MAQDPEVQQPRARAQMETSPPRPVSGALIAAGPYRPVGAPQAAGLDALRAFCGDSAWKNTETKKRSDGFRGLKRAISGVYYRPTAGDFDRPAGSSS